MARVAYLNREIAAYGALAVEAIKQRLRASFQPSNPGETNGARFRPAAGRLYQARWDIRKAD